MRKFIFMAAVFAAMISFNMNARTNKETKATNFFDNTYIHTYTFLPNFIITLHWGNYKLVLFGNKNFLKKWQPSGVDCHGFY